jgi:hypothetical protein
MGICMGTSLGKLWETQLLGHVLGHVWDVFPQKLWDLEFMGKCVGTPGMPLGSVWDISLSTSVSAFSFPLFNFMPLGLAVVCIPAEKHATLGGPGS